jgi:hypothetical protein
LSEKSEILKKFQMIPGVGKAIAQDLWNLGLRSFEELGNADPENLYEKVCILQHCEVDRCMLYVFRCAVYYVSQTNHDPELLKWWNWKDSKIGK